MRFFMLSVTLLFSLVLPQANTWTLMSTGQTGAGGRIKPALVYTPDSNRYFFMLGGANDSASYSELMYTSSIGKWINFFPEDTLYGPWGDSTGQTRGLGRMGQPVFNSYYFIFKNIIYGGRTYLRPNLHHNRQSVAFQQYAYNPDDKKVYFYTFNMTFTYNTLTRRWDTLQTGIQPDPSSKGQLRWGCMAYDPVHREMVLAGGGGADARFGGAGTWVFKTASRTWEKLSVQTEPPYRAYASMATDYASNKILFFGGDHLDYLMNDTWIYDCAARTWEKKSPNKNPAPRAGHAMVYLPKSRKIVLMGGYEYTNCTGYGCAIYRTRPTFDLWTYDMAASEWKLIKSYGSSETVPLYVASDHLNAAADTSDRILVYGSSDRFYSMTCDPTATDDAGTQSLGVAADIFTHRTDPWLPSYFDAGVPVADTAAIEVFLRNLAADTWTNVIAPKKPASNHDWGTTVYDSDRDLVLKFSGGHSAHCGNEVDQYAISSNRWHISAEPEWPLEYTYDAGLPMLFSFSGRPMVTHSYDNYCYDTLFRRMVYVKPYYTFLYNPDIMEWDSVFPNPASFTTDYHHISVNRTRHGSVAWVLRNGTSQYDLYLLDKDSLRWRLLPRTGDALPSSYGDNAGAAYDSKRNRLIMVYGTSSTNPDMRAYDFATGASSRITPANNASITGSDTYRECLYLPDLDMVMVQALISNQTLFYDCANNNWVLVTIPKGAGVGSVSGRTSGYMLDTRRNLIWDSETNCETYVLKLTPALFTAAEAAACRVDLSPGLSITPNPFAAAAVITVRPRGVPVTVHDLSGRMVARLSSSLASGSVQWKAEGLSSGVYIVSIRAKGAVIRAKVTLMK